MHVATARRVAGPVRCAPQAAAEPQTVIACHGFGRVVLTSREHIIGLEPLDKGLMGMLLTLPVRVAKRAQVVRPSIRNDGRASIMS